MVLKKIHEPRVFEWPQRDNELKCFTEGCEFTSLIDATYSSLSTFRTSNLIFPEANLFDLQCTVSESIVIHESKPSSSVDMVFMLDGNMKASFAGSDTEIEMIAGTNNLKYTPSEKISRIAVPKYVRCVVVSFDKKYFQSLIGDDNVWAELMQEKLEREENFFASDNFLVTTSQMQSLINAILSTPRSPISRMRIQSMIFELIGLQIDQLLHQTNRKKNDLPKEDVQKLHDIKRFIEQHFLQEHTLTSLCRQVCLNEFKLKKGFKMLFGTSVIQYVRQLRMEYARALLRDSAMLVEEVSTQVGYLYPNHFSTAYKKHFGVLPSQR